jgi:hypothetical protein
MLIRLTIKIHASIVLTYLDKCGFSTLIARCSHMVNSLLAVPEVSALTFQNDESGIIYFERLA